jgi:hypothetical protein
MREHNRIAGRMQQDHPEWGDEKLYQEARRRVIAEMQVITYKECFRRYWEVLFRRIKGTTRM